MSFSPKLKVMVFHWSLSDSKSLQVSRTLLSILTNDNNAVVRMISTGPLIYKSSSPFINILVTLPSAPFTIDIKVTVPQFFSILYQGRGIYSFFFSHYFTFILWSALTVKSTIL